MKKSEPITCPGLFYGTSAKDGTIFLLRTPGGIINSNQCRAIAELAEQLADGYIQITNRANLQIRGVGDKISLTRLKHLQAIGNSEGSNPHVNNKFGQLAHNDVLAEVIPALIEQILQKNYQTSNSQSLTSDRNDP